MSIQKIGILGLLILLSFVGCTKEEKKEPVEAKQQMATKVGDGFSLEAAKVKFDWTIDSDKIKITLSAPTTGWIGIGFNPTEEMKDANFYIGFVKDSEVKVIDQHGTSKRLHKEDESLGGKNDVADVSGKEENKTTKISFTAPLKTGDTLDGEIKLNTDITVLLAYGKSDRMAQQHLANTTLKLNLSTGSYKVLQISK